MELLSVFSICIILLVLKSIFNEGQLNFNVLFKYIFTLYILTSITINTGYAIKIGNSSIAYNTLFSLVLLVLSVILIYYKKFNKKILVYGILLYLSVFLGYVLFVIIPYKGGMIQSLELWDGYIRGELPLVYEPSLPHKLFNWIISVIRMPLILSVASYILNKSFMRRMSEKIYALSNLILIYGFIELITKKLLKSTICNIFVTYFFGDIGENGSVGRLNGFTKEPSQYALVLFIFSLFILIEYRFRTKNDKTIKNKDLISVLIAYKIIWIKLGLIYTLMLFSGSIISYYLFCISFCCFLYQIDIRKLDKCIIKPLLIFIVILILLVVIFGLPSALQSRIDRILNVIKTIYSGQKYQSYETSEGARLVSISEMVKCFINRPLFGVGLGVTDAHSTIFSVLANFGIVGSILLSKIWKEFAKTSFKSKYFWMIIISMLLSGGLGYFMELYYPFIIYELELSEKGD